MKTRCFWGGLFAFILVANLTACSVVSKNIRQDALSGVVAVAADLDEIFLAGDHVERQLRLIAARIVVVPNQPIGSGRALGSDIGGQHRIELAAAQTDRCDPCANRTVTEPDIGAANGQALAIVGGLWLFMEEADAAMTGTEEESNTSLWVMGGGTVLLLVARYTDPHPVEMPEIRRL